MKASLNRFGQAGVASLPVSGSIMTNVMPSGASNSSLLPTGERRLHELRPDGQRRLRTAEPDRLVVVEAHPDHGEQFRREAGEPRVPEIVRRPGLAGRIEREAGAACAAAVPSFRTLRIMLVTRNVVSGRAIVRGSLDAVSSSHPCRRW